LVVFGFNDWPEWKHGGFRTRSAITTLKLSERSDIGRVLVVGSASSVWANALRAVGQAVGREPRAGTAVISRVEQRVAEKVWTLGQARMIPREDGHEAAYRMNGVVHDDALRRRIRAAVERLGMRDVVLWVANPLMAKHIGTLGESLSVFDAIDDWSKHPQKVAMRQSVLAGYETVRERADVVFTVSRDLASRLGHGRDGVRWIPNGVDIGRFESLTGVPDELAGLPTPILGYVGTLQERVDVDMLLAAARQFAGASLVLVGPMVSPAHFSRLSGLPNVHLLGAQPGHRVPQLIGAFDVCLLPHVDDAFTRSMDPMKLYEYLAAGKPVVASGPVSESVRGLVRHADDSETFVSALRDAVGEDDAAAQLCRREFARSRSWDGVVDEMVAELRTAMGRRQGSAGLA
jgi:glycosyltransferase involved in cell wall biosynthesis